MQKSVISILLLLAPEARSANLALTSLADAEVQTELSEEEVRTALENVLQPINGEFENRRLVLSRLTLQDKVKTSLKSFVLEFPKLDEVIANIFEEPHKLRKLTPLNVALRTSDGNGHEEPFQVLARFQVERKVLVAKETLDRETELSPQHFEWAWQEERGMHDDTFESVEELVGLVTKRTLIKGQALRQSYVKHKTAIKRGQMVRVNFNLSAISISSHVKALEDGAIGQDIQVMHPTTRKILQAKVISDSHVQATTN